ncbi:MAG: hypothetical protein HYT47_01535 [Candidatus Vogelbacteria bacterium]|nr:hypothetical protein [Candidatus Vogelbacteria bacterium]
MAFWRLLKSYLGWHYSAALVAWWRIDVNILWFLFHFFSIGLVLRTLFSPWRRLAENYPRRFVPTAIAGAVVVNLLMRLVGLTIRLFFLSFALAVLIGAWLLGWIVLVVWLLAPFLIVSLFSAGFYLTFLT